MANEIPNLMHACVSLGFRDFGSGPQLAIVGASGINLAACEHPAPGDIVVHLDVPLGAGERAISNGFGQTLAADPAAAFVTILDDTRYRVRPLIIGDPTSRTRVAR